jgi:hypothetical protein
VQDFLSLQVELAPAILFHAQELQSPVGWAFAGLYAQRVNTWVLFHGEYLHRKLEKRLPDGVCVYVWSAGF